VKSLEGPGWRALSELSELPLPHERRLDSQFAHVRVPFDTLPAEIRLTNDPEEQRLFLISAGCVDELGATFVLIQPEVFARDPRRGWVPIGGHYGSVVFVGREESYALDYVAGMDESHCLVAVRDDAIEVTNWSDSGMVRIQHL
jgi:hypothetical protein